MDSLYESIRGRQQSSNISTLQIALMVSFFMTFSVIFYEKVLRSDDMQIHTSVLSQEEIGVHKRILYGCHDKCRPDCWMDMKCRHDCMVKKCQFIKQTSTFCLDHSNEFLQWVECLDKYYPEKEDWFADKLKQQNGIHV